MRTLTAPTLRHVGACVLCVIIGIKYSAPLDGTEFGGGSVTGPVLTVHSVSLVLFVVSAIVIFASRGGATIIALVACLLSLPLYLYFTVPGLFRRVFLGEYSVPLSASVVWDTWALAGIAAICVLTIVTLTGSDRRSLTSEP
jgi:hypothetical protein